jgi:hypothetical protein
LLLSRYNTFPGSNCGLHLLFLNVIKSEWRERILTYSVRVLFDLSGIGAALGLLLTGFLVILFLDGLADDFHQVLLQGLLLKDQTVLVPDEVGGLGVPPVLLHASLEETKDILVIGVLSELKFAAIVHELAEFLGVTLTQLINSDFELLLLDVVILLVLRASWKALPRKTASQEVQQHVSDSLEIISP